MRVENGNRMQNVAALGCILLNNTHDCYMKFDNVRIFLTLLEKYWYMKSVTYLYHFFERCEKMVPILLGVKFTKCEIYGSTQLLIIVDWKTWYKTNHYTLGTK